MAFAREAGFGALAERGVAAAEGIGPDVVYAGFSFGVMPAQAAGADPARRARGRADVGCLPVSEFGDAWPDGVPVQVHGKEADPFFAEDLEAARALAESTDRRRAVPLPGRGASLRRLIASGVRRRRCERCSPSACWRSSSGRVGGVWWRATYTIKALDESTWDAFAALVEHNNGVFGGCWCIGFHPEGADKETTAALNRRRKLKRVKEGKAHAALVFDGDDCVGWCQFGVPDEVPRIKSRADVREGPDDLPDWRIACNFVGKGHRRRGVATAALAGALDLIARLGRRDRRGISGGRRRRCPPASSSTVHCRPTSGSASRATARSASTAGS